MITELTKEQVAKFPEYVSKWTTLGLTTKRRTLKDAKRDFTQFQTVILKKEPVEVILLDSPRQCNIEIKKQLKIADGEKMQCIYPYYDCQYWAGWFSFYDFMEKELGIEYTVRKEYNVLISCQAYGMVYPLDTVCIVCQPPTIIKRNASGLHCEDGAALSYNGDNELYALNGVVMPKEYVMTSSNKLTSEVIMKETNVEIRRELIRKVGIERVMEQMPHKLLDKRDNYELYEIELTPEIKNAKYLKMKNPSISTFHLEGVAPEITTIKEALLWRNQNLFENADILT